MIYCIFFVLNIVVFCVFKFFVIEEKLVFKKFGLIMFVVFEKSDFMLDVKLCCVKSEKKVRLKSVGNVDLLLWKDDGIIFFLLGLLKKEKIGSLLRFKSIVF